jgi:MerR family transcriptional regulator/heat shock protein HspR
MERYMTLDSSEPIYPISVAAKLLSVHPRTLRIYEEEGLIKPARQGNKRYFSNNDIEWVTCLRTLIHEKGISIPGIKMLLELTPCWEITKCPPEKRDDCSAYIDRTIPCWQKATTACAKDFGQCDNCEVYIRAMKEVRELAATSNSSLVSKTDGQKLQATEK